jgi:hypothetical protein
MGQHCTTLRTARLHRVIHAPSDVIGRTRDSDWTPGLDEEITQMRQSFIDMREQWPPRPASDGSAR